jgi:hypothetical protein
MSTQNTTVTQISDAELDAVGAGGLRFNYVGIFAVSQTNLSQQTSVNVLSIGSGNQVAYQSNNASVG